MGVLWALTSGSGVAVALLQGSAGPLIGVAISASLLPPVVNCVSWAFHFMPTIRLNTFLFLVSGIVLVTWKTSQVLLFDHLFNFQGFGLYLVDLRRQENPASERWSIHRRKLVLRAGVHELHSNGVPDQRNCVSFVDGRERDLYFHNCHRCSQDQRSCCTLHQQSWFEKVCKHGTVHSFYNELDYFYLKILGNWHSNCP